MYAKLDPSLKKLVSSDSVFNVFKLCRYLHETRKLAFRLNFKTCKFETCSDNLECFIKKSWIESKKKRLIYYGKISNGRKFRLEIHALTDQKTIYGETSHRCVLFIKRYDIMKYEELYDIPV